MPTTLNSIGQATELREGNKPMGERTIPMNDMPGTVGGMAEHLLRELSKSGMQYARGPKIEVRGRWYQITIAKVNKPTEIDP